MAAIWDNHKQKKKKIGNPVEQICLHSLNYGVTQIYEM